MANTYEDTRILSINSIDGMLMNGSYLSNVFFKFSGLLKQEKDVLFTEISLQNLQLPVSFYIISVYNRLLNLDVGGTIYTIEFDRGNYNINELITMITGKFVLNGLNNFVITYNMTNGLIKFQNNAEFTFLSSSTCFQILGFTKSQNHTSSLNVLFGEYPVNLLGTLKINVLIPDISIMNYDSKNNKCTNLLASIPKNAGPRGLILWDNTANRKSILKNDTVDGFTLYLLDDNGDFLNMNNTHWTCTIVITIHRVLKEKDNLNLNDVVKTFLDLKPQEDQPEEQTQEIPEEIQQPQEVQSYQPDQNDTLDDILFDNGIF